MFKTFGRFFSNMEEYDLRTNIENAFEGDVRRKRDISNNLITFVDLIEGINFTGCHKVFIFFFL